MEPAFWTSLPLLFVVGAAAGLVTSMLGIGGSIVIVPALLIALPLLHVPDSAVPAMALGTSLTVSLATALSSAFNHHRLGNLRDPLAPEKLGLMLCAGVGAFLGAQAVSAVAPWLAMLVIAAAQIGLGWAILRPRRQAAQAGAAPAATSQRAFDERAPAARAYLGMAGFLTSIGAGGSLIVPYLTLRGVEHREAVALAGWLGVLIGAAALAVYGTRSLGSLPYCLGAVHAPAAALIAAGSLLGTRAGATFATRVDQAVLRNVLAAALLLSSARLLMKLPLAY